MKKSKRNATIEEEILLLQEKGKDSPITIGEILSILSEKGQSLMILFLCLPFCQPLQIPGFSTPFGLAIAFLGLKMAFGQYAWLPKSILTKSIPSPVLKNITEKVLWVLNKVRGWIHPRLIWLCSYSAAQIVNGLLISILGLLLALPLPIPFSNLIAAWAILFLGLGLLEEDGVFILIGYCVSLLAFAYFIATVLLINSFFRTI